jgi:hypothetical protein
LWRLLHLLTAAFFVIAVLAPTALAQDATNEKTGGEDPFFVAPKDETTELSAHHMKQEHHMKEETTSGVSDLPTSGGLPVLLSASALLLDD